MNTNNKTFNSFWQDLKPQVTFEYSTLPYDTDKKSLKQALTQKKEIEEIVLERSEPMWRNLFDEEFGITSFYLDMVEITARAWSHSPVCRIDLLTKKYQADCQKIESRFFKFRLDPHGNWKINYTVSEVMENYKKLANFRLKIVNKNFGIADIVDAIGTGLDPKIKPLIQVLNQLGITTTASCEGHIDHGLPYPWIHVSMLDLPKFLAILNTLSEKDFLEFTLESYKYDFRFRPPSIFSLEQGQAAFQRLATLLLI